MVGELGETALGLAFLFGLYATIVAAVGGVLRRDSLTQSASRAVYVVYLCVTIAVGSLLTLLMSSDFTNKYVASYTNAEMEPHFKFVALWGGYEGSLLFWSWILMGFCSAVVFFNRSRYRRMMPYVISTIMFVACFFLAVNLFFKESNPFQAWQRVMDDGSLTPMGVSEVVSTRPPRGLNPQLQHWAMISHPPLLYLGLTGFLIPFAFAVAALITGQLGETWIRAIRRWTIVPWFFLGLGLILGGRWAYEELGWGGYWAWDPVENAALMPWLLGTAFLHSVMIQEKKGMLKVWNVILVILTFSFCILGTGITRSGLIQSVHAFAESKIGWLFLALFGLILGVGAVLVIWRLPKLKSEHKLDSLASRESSFVFQNLLLLAATLIVLVGTLYPKITEWLGSPSIMMGPPWFNMILGPVTLGILFLAGAGPLFAWRRTSVESLKKAFIVPCVLSIPLGIATYWLIRGRFVHEGGFFSPLGNQGFFHSPMYTDIICLGVYILAIWLGIIILREFINGALTRGRTANEPFFTALWRLTLKNKRRYGGYIIHFGFAVMMIGFAGKAFDEDIRRTLQPGVDGQDVFKLGRYQFRLKGAAEGEAKNYAWVRLTVDIEKDGQFWRTLYPEQRLYANNPDMPTTSEPSIVMGIIEDVYLINSGPVPPMSGGGYILHAWVNPLVFWVFFGMGLIAFGTFICMLPDQTERRILERVAAAEENLHREAESRDS
ncbi:MAG: heme lyase CcmF/NrfE family subunit [Planctomycetota bacterium]